MLAKTVVALLFQLGLVHLNTAFAPSQVHSITKQQQHPSSLHHLRVAVPDIEPQRQSAELLSKLALLEKVRCDRSLLL